MARRVLPLRICCVHRSTSSGTKYLCIIGVWALFRLRSLTRFAGGAGRSSTCVPKFVGRCLPSASLPGVSPLSGGGHRKSRNSCASEFSSSSQRSEEHTSELQSRSDLVCRLLLEKKKKINLHTYS